jgi:hypothetical protein
MTMPKMLTFLHASAIAGVIASATMVQPASAISADLAKKCREMMVKARPVEPAGSSRGSAQAERDYFRQCIDRQGKMDDPPSPPSPPSPPADGRKK